MIKHSFQTTNQTIVFDDVAYTAMGNYTLDVYRKNSNTSIVFTHSDATTFLAEYQKYLEYKANLSAATLEAAQTTIAINKLVQEQLEGNIAIKFLAQGLKRVFPEKPNFVEIDIIVDASTYEEACEKAEAMSFRGMSKDVEFEPRFYWFKSSDSVPDQLEIRRRKDE